MLFSNKCQFKATSSPPPLHIYIERYKQFQRNTCILIKTGDSHDCVIHHNTFAHIHIYTLRACAYTHTYIARAHTHATYIARTHTHTRHTKYQTSILGERKGSEKLAETGSLDYWCWKRSMLLPPFGGEGGRVE